MQKKIQDLNKKNKTKNKNNSYQLQNYQKKKKNRSAKNQSLPKLTPSLPRHNINQKKYKIKIKFFFFVQPFGCLPVVQIGKLQYNKYSYTITISNIQNQKGKKIVLITLISFNDKKQMQTTLMQLTGQYYVEINTRKLKQFINSHIIFLYDIIRAYILYNTHYIYFQYFINLILYNLIQYQKYIQYQQQQKVFQGCIIKQLIAQRNAQKKISNVCQHISLSNKMRSQTLLTQIQKIT
eukprot:TRINITY_DN3412_c0_g1_i10.p2 TRINITY_DN3412_c0_g1~~TRINITY_DN3412_c0_g1_i10.p2  ORF type:complete len:247 (-),score=-10.88 TRINITY_DN3412_c0_g1_i10:920-1630(-)